VKALAPTGWYSFYPTSPMPDALKSALRDFPGAYLRTRWSGSLYIRAHENAAWLVERMLANAGVKFRVVQPPPVPKLEALPPISELHEWVPDFLTAYQRDGLLFSIPRDGTHAWHAPGAGKSLLAIVWALAAPGLSVIVTRASAVPQFAKEIRRFTTVQPALVSGLSPLEPAELERLKSARIILTSWSVLTPHVKELVSLGPTSVVFDESHFAKSWKRQRAILQPDGTYKYVELENVSSSAKKLSLAAKRRLATTASPIRDRVRDLWAQLDLIHPWAWGSFGKWARRYSAAFVNTWGGFDSKGKAAPPILDELKLRCSLVAHVVPHAETHRDLPPCRFACVYVPTSELNKDSGFAAEMKRVAKLGRQAQLEAKLMQAASMKRKYAVGLVEEAVRAGQKVVVFTGRRKDVELFAAAVQKALGEADVSVWASHGADSADERERIRVAYMECPGPAVLIATGDSFGEAISLHDTDLALFVMLPVTPGQFTQWKGRFTRRGQKRPVFVQALVAEGTVDEHVADLLLKKLPAVDRVVGDTGLDGVERELATGGKSDEELLDSLWSKVLGGTEADGDAAAGLER